MTQAQLLAVDSILPTVLGCAGLVFLAVGLWPLGGAIRASAARSAGFGIAGAACVAVSVYLWLAVVHAAGQVAGPALSPPSVSPSPAATAAATASAPPSTAASSPTASAAAKPSAPASASAAASPSAAAKPSGSPAPAATPSIPPNLTPVQPVPFQPENTPQHAAIIGVQSFEHGSMLYRDDLKHIYVLTLDQKFKVYPDTWKQGTNPDLGAGPIDAKFYPGRGFGWLWASDPDVRQALGLGVTAEAGFTGSIQGDGTTTIIKADVTYAFNKDGTWALK